MKGSSQTTEQKLDIMIELLQHLLVLELARSGVKQAAIGKHVRIATAKVNGMLRGVKKGRGSNE